MKHIRLIFETTDALVAVCCGRAPVCMVGAPVGLLLMVKVCGSLYEDPVTRDYEETTWVLGHDERGQMPGN